MWDYRAVSRIDLRILPIVFCLMAIGLRVISSMTGMEARSDVFWTPPQKSAALVLFRLGRFFFAAGFDYRNFAIGALFYMCDHFIVRFVFCQSDSKCSSLVSHPRIDEFSAFRASETDSCHRSELVFGEERERLSGAYHGLAGGFLVGSFFIDFKAARSWDGVDFYPIALGDGYFAGLHRGFVIIDRDGTYGVCIVSLAF